MRLNTSKIAYEMKRLGMNQSALARALNCTRQYASLVMKGDVKTLKSIEKIAKVFNIDPRDLIE